LIDIEEKEILRKEKELISTVKRPAEAQAYKVETIAEGQRLDSFCYLLQILYMERYFVNGKIVLTWYKKL
jgi:hypothetical protein